MTAILVIRLGVGYKTQHGGINMRILFLAALAALASSGPGDEALMERAAGHLRPLKSQLQSELKAGMEKGVEAAIEVCHVRAPQIAARLQTESLEMGRTSHRLRNPDNAPRPWIDPILAKYRADPKSAGPEIVRLSEGRIGYVEPILTQPLCLVCHGAAIAEPVRTRIEELYPSDRATGFERGDLRGVFWVEMSGEPASEAKAR